jgi:hypothetical protein
LSSTRCRSSLTIDRYGSEQYRAVYSGDPYVLIDAHDAGHVRVIDSSQHDPLDNRFYDRYFQPSHSGWQVNGWWRIIDGFALAITLSCLGAALAIGVRAGTGQFDRTRFAAIAAPVRPGHRRVVALCFRAAGPCSTGSNGCVATTRAC